MKHILNQFYKSQYAWINCHECFTPKLIFNRILRSWFTGNDIDSIPSCDSMDDFLDYVKCKLDPKDETRFIVSYSFIVMFMILGI